MKKILEIETFPNVENAKQNPRNKIPQKFGKLSKIDNSQQWNNRLEILKK